MGLFLYLTAHYGWVALATESRSPPRPKASFRPPPLQPGESRLQVTLKDPSGATHSSTTAFTVGGGAKATR